MNFTQIDPADLRFTQESVGLYFKQPHNHFSIREAVRKISRKEMTPNEFPCLRVIFYEGCHWSLDNRRLWVFRIARCPSIHVILMTRWHPRLQELVASSHLLNIMKGADFFPRVRDRGEKDWAFDHLFPEPSSLQRVRQEDFMQPTKGNARHQWKANYSRPNNVKPDYVKQNSRSRSSGATSVAKKIADILCNFFAYVKKALFGA